ncbi:hypothetical protein DCCM_2573 [Desulfocucumis palustris]|uniref:Uncharacterized protein n=1 Tax=Desulfocucumis palustris TaxID=1898651 RepID=A0A2L2XHW1_9FIRM|nr:hypothetical protein DCCM_2573 [Desulfocucumis palustris]
MQNFPASEGISKILSKKQKSHKQLFIRRAAVLAVVYKKVKLNNTNRRVECLKGA